ncbi:hypothetical protein GDO81_002976 [Engystomops pustulosus]|uniref:Uncharacterized protein n=1 Tax=Engystomops pustulosus TaxID=76066 RepID=A0AAV7DP09_ENGPU|nr:hypothetical protein GDO81_002976 [Engystomops pustulosus]
MVIFKQNTQSTEVHLTTTRGALIITNRNRESVEKKSYLCSNLLFLHHGAHFFFNKVCCLSLDFSCVL